ncbi:MAG TPA: inositol monophosphatase family protein [Thermoanaerobaculia bacterium]|jgi:myo-inositol-1(or 4)-monophosphatase|nr:inositol monophosphatase family protein [Thermoanaerobaculia bacterium]
MTVDTTHALALAKRAARDAVLRLKTLLDKEVVIDSDSARDVKLAADRESERTILQILRSGSDWPVLSEESGWSGDSRAPVRWIVDPLDGSMNYLRRIPFCCVSIALWQDDEPLLGVIHDIDRDEIFSGVVGDGAWFNEAPMHVSAATRSDSAVLCMGFPLSTDFSPEALGRYIEHIRGYKKIRFLGSAALSLAYVGAGRTDAYYERDIKLWDIAAGLAIVSAAGGVVVKRPTTIEAAYDVAAAASASVLPGVAR